MASRGCGCRMQRSRAPAASRRSGRPGKRSASGSMVAAGMMASTYWKKGLCSAGGGGSIALGGGGGLRIIHAIADNTQEAAMEAF